jgi:membrane fusion protein, copper/silver efflux system
MTFSTRRTIALLGAAAFLLGAGSGLGVAYRGPVATWLGSLRSTLRASGAPAPQPAAAAPDPQPTGAAEATAATPPGAVELSPEKQQLIGVRTTEVRRIRVARTLRTVGRLEADETKIARIHVKVAGWVEKVDVDFTGQLVKRGEPLFSLYSPDLVSTQQEYLIARRGESDLGKSPYPEVAAGAASLVEATRERLRLWDVTEAQILRLERTGEVRRTLTLYSPINGFVLSRNLYEQSYVTPQTELYEIADLSSIWVYADIYEYEMPYVKVGQEATMELSYFPGKVYRGRLDYVYPTLDPQTRTLRVRLEFPNPGFDLKPGMFADVEIKVDYGVQTVVPAEAVLNSGTRQIVFLARPGGHFVPRQIELGPQVGNETVVLRGLVPGETIVSSGNFLVDSESQLQAALGGFAPAPSPAPAAAQAPQAEIRFSTDPAPPAKGSNLFRVHLSDAHGAGLAGAAVEVVFFMPAMPAMGMPPARLSFPLRELGGGDYQGTGKLTSGGSWQVTVVATRNGQTLATRQLSVTATGGM